MKQNDYLTKYVFYYIIRGYFYRRKMHYFISDLHYGVCQKGDASVHRLANMLERESTAQDTLFIGGDIAIDDPTVRACLRAFNGFRGRRFAILGNHDLWVEPGDHSLARHARLQNILDEEGFHPLEEKSVIVNGWGFIGALGWYDYSFKDNLDIPESCYREKRDPHTGFVVWNDARYVRWNMTDEEATEWQVQKLRARLSEVQDAERVVALVHHVPHKDLLVHPRFLVPKHWRFANAFLGSNQLAEVLEQDPRVKHVINGHIHMSRSTKRKHIEYTSIGGDYDAKQLLAFDGKNLKRISIT